MQMQHLYLRAFVSLSGGCVSVCGMVPLGVSVTSAVTSAGLSRGFAGWRGGSISTSARPPRLPPRVNLTNRANPTPERGRCAKLGRLASESLTLSRNPTSTPSRPASPALGRNALDPVRGCVVSLDGLRPLPTSRLRVSTIAMCAISATCARIRSTRHAAH